MWLEERFGVNFRKLMSGDQGPEGVRGFFRAALRWLDKWEMPSQEDDFSRGMALRGCREKTRLSVRLAPFLPGTWIAPLGPPASPAGPLIRPFRP